MPKIGNYLNYSTIYKAKINGAIFKETRQRDVCFGSSLSRCIRQQNQAEYTIVLVTSPSYIETNNYNNYCWMSKHQVENYLRRIKSIKPFTYNVKEARWNGYNCYDIHLKMTGTKKEITFVLQSIKRTYEFPFNYLLFEAYQMQRLPAFKFDSVLNLFDVAWVSHYGQAYNSGHSYSGNSYFVKYKDLRERLPHVNYATELFISNRGKATKMIPYDNKSMVNSYSIPKDTVNWTEENFRKFLPTYIENYKVLKQ